MEVYDKQTDVCEARRLWVDWGCLKDGGRGRDSSVRMVKRSMIDYKPVTGSPAGLEDGTSVRVQGSKGGEGPFNLKTIFNGAQ